MAGLAFADRSPPEISMLLSKSTFLRSLDCPVCLRHVAVGLPSNREGDEFLRLLVEGGFQFEKLVRHAWPGTELPRAGSDHELAHRKTVEAIRKARSGAGGTLHEATILHSGCLARIDMLRVSPDGLEVCEVKAKSFLGTDDRAAAADVVASGHAELNGRNGVRGEWRRYLADIAFQVEVLERWLRSEGIRGIEILPRLIVANRNQRSGEHDSLGNLRVDAGSALGRGMVTPGDIQWVRCPPAGFRSPLICELDVTMEVAEVRRSVSGAAESPWGGIGLGGQVDTAKSILAGSREADPARYRGWKCRNCEFHTARATEVPTGFDACWGSGAHSADALLRLYWGGKYRPSSGPAAAGSEGVAQGRDWVAITVAHTERHPARIADLPPDAGSGVQARTRNLQIAAERSGDVQCSEDFAERVQRDLLRDPRPERVHFLDFETSMACLPLAPGMRPYEIMAFQFSCHTIPLEEGRLAVDRAVHAAWLDDGSEPPASSLGIDRAFIDALEAAVGQDVTPIFHWSSHEKTVLKNVLRSRLALAGDPSDLRRVEFIDSVVGDENQPGRLVDMLRVAEGGVMAPGQQGRYSIKCVLPVACQVDRVWSELCALMSGDFPASAAASSARDPYRMLGPLAGRSDAETEDDEGGSSGGDDGVQCGTAAMRAYQQLRFGGVARWEGVDRHDLKAALLRYCKLDTAAMVAVWSWMVGEAARRSGSRG